MGRPAFRVTASKTLISQISKAFSRLGFQYSTCMKYGVRQVTWIWLSSEDLAMLTIYDTDNGTALRAFIEGEQT